MLSSANGLLISLPALLIKISMLFIFLLTNEKRFFELFSEAISKAIGINLLFGFCFIAASFNEFNLTLSRDIAITLFFSSLLNCKAVSNPIPLLAPVIT